MDFSEMTAEKLYFYGLMNSNTTYSLELIDALIKTRDIHWMASAGRYWDSNIYDDKLLDNIFLLLEDESKDTKSRYFYAIGDKYPFDRCDKRVVDGLLDNAKPLWLFSAGRDWEDRLYDKRIVDALLETENSLYLSSAIIQWPKHRYDERMLDFFINKDSSMRTYDELVAIYQDGIENIGFNRRVMEKLLMIVDECGYRILWDGSNVMGGDWCDNEFSLRIAMGVFKSRYSNEIGLFNMGKYWSDDTFIPEIGHYLYKTGNKKLIELSAHEWPKDRSRHVERPKITVDY